MYVYIYIYVYMHIYDDVSGALDVTGEGEGFDSDRYKSPYFDRFRDLEWVSVEIQSYLFSVYSRIE
jgi:hypothetical protein